MAVFAVTTAKGPNWDHARGIREQEAWREHAAFSDNLVDRGFVILGGPIDNANDEDVALLVVEAGGEAEVRSIFDHDPWSAVGILFVREVWCWTLWLDGRRTMPYQDDS